MNDTSREIEFYLFKIVIMLPPIFLLAYVLPGVYTSLNYYIFIPIIVLPLTRFFMKRRLFSYVYPVYTFAFLLVILYSLVQDIGLFSNSILNHLLISMDFRTLISVTLAIGIVVVEEGIITRKIHRTVGSVIFSNLFLLEQFAAVYLMEHPDSIAILGNQHLTFYQAFSEIVYMELVSMYSFIVNGYQYMLPLATFSLPFGKIMLTLFLISIIALLLFLYRSDTRWISERGITLGYSVIAGTVVGAVGIIMLDRLNSLYYGQGFLIFFVIAVMLIALHTSRRGDYERIENEPEEELVA